MCRCSEVGPGDVDTELLEASAPLLARRYETVSFGTRCMCMEARRVHPHGEN